MTENQKNKLGQIGEECAGKFLQEKGFEIIERNFRFKRSGEIDIIALKNNLLLFVEVKSRKSSIYGGALYSISSKKKRTIRFVAEQFLLMNEKYNTKEVTCRFDLIAIEDDSVKWIEDILR